MLIVGSSPVAACRGLGEFIQSLSDYLSLQLNILEMKVIASNSLPGSFEPPFYRAGSPLTLICNVEGAEEDSSGLLYEWRSTCKGNCFVRSGHTKSVSTRYLHSYDSGVHTCVVYDRGGCTGNASTTVNVTGEIEHSLWSWQSVKAFETEIIITLLSMTP